MTPPAALPQASRTAGQPCLRLDIVAHDGDAADLVRIILRVADGHVWVAPVVSMVRARTGQRGVDAL